MFVLRESAGAAVFQSGKRHLRIAFITPACVRVTYTEGTDFVDRPSRIVVADRASLLPQIEESPDRLILSAGSLQVTLDKQTGALSYRDAAGRLLLREPERGGKWLTPKRIDRNVFAKDASVALGQSIDGARAAATRYETVFDREAFEAKLEFVFADDEALFGLGSHEEGYANLRGHSRDLYQQNMKAVVPYFVSTRGYGVLLDCCSLMTFHDDAYGSYWWADAVEELDFYVIQGDSFDEVTRGYHHLTGPAPLLPKWAFGYIQSKERYVSAQELIDVVREYRRRRVPLDAVVLDWKSWPNGGGWGQKSLDPARFPDPDAMMTELHSLGARLMVSIWPLMTGGCADQRQLLERGLMLGNQSTYDAFSAEARACYWQQAYTGLFSHGIDGWWCDCTEPFEADWSGAVRPEPHVRLSMNTEESKRYLDAAEINAYSLLHAQGIYEGQRGVTEAKRVLNLTRSSYAGQHRYAAVTWNGDISATWDALRRSIAEGLNFCAAGEPWWTVDIGGFFVAHDPNLWFWRGDYSDGCRGLTAADAMQPDPQDTGCRDLGHWELYTRWVQFAAFLPMFRSHGTDAAREVWRFGEVGSPFYDTIARFIRLRYELMPYIYSIAAQVTLHSASMIRALALAFPHDRRTHDIADQFCFGPALLVCPVTRPMYYERESRPLPEAAKTRRVYLPEGHNWFDFWTGTLYRGGEWITADAPLEKIPLFARSGSVLPMTQPMQYVDEVPAAPWEIRVYAGADGECTLYEDAGDGYQYEQGAYSLVRITWNDRDRILTLHARAGGFAELVQQRSCSIVVISDSGVVTRSVSYTRDKLRIDV